LTDRGMQFDAIMQSRLIKFSSVGILLCRHRHTTKDLEGGVNLYQINDDQETWVDSDAFLLRKWV
jgi:hypothetical protein